MVMQLVILTASNFEVGACYGPRYWVPFLPWMAVAAVATFQKARWSWKLVFIALAIVSLVFSIGSVALPPDVLDVAMVLVASRGISALEGARRMLFFY